MSELIHKARIFAIQKHQRINQKRASSRKAPDAHLKAVAELVSRTTGDADVIVAAWLHDVVEDTPATFEDVEREFGSRVSRLVEEVTDTSRPTDGGYAARKAIDQTHAARASVSAKNIMLADLIDTCPDACSGSPQHARAYLVRASSLLAVLGDGDPKLHARAKKTVNQGAADLGLTVSEGETPPRFEARQDGADRPFAARWRRLFVEAFTAAEIGEALHSFDLGTSREVLASTMGRLQLEVVGIRRDGTVVGYLGHGDVTGEDPERAFRPFSERQVLDGSAPLADVIYVLTHRDYCFVSLFDSVVGVISRTDIQKPVVRMWLFGMVTFLELDLTDRIQRIWPGDSWHDKVSPARLGRARALLEERRRRNLPGSLLECLQFADKMQLLAQDPGQRAEFGFKTKGAADRVIKDLESLRNNLAHAQDIVSHDWPQIARFAYQILVSREDR